MALGEWYVYATKKLLERAERTSDGKYFITPYSCRQVLGSCLRLDRRLQGVVLSELSREGIIRIHGFRRIHLLKEKLME